MNPGFGFVNFIGIEVIDLVVGVGNVKDGVFHMQFFQLAFLGRVTSSSKWSSSVCSPGRTIRSPINSAAKLGSASLIQRIILRPPRQHGFGCGAKVFFAVKIGVYFVRIEQIRQLRRAGSHAGE